MVVGLDVGHVGDAGTASRRSRRIDPCEIAARRVPAMNALLDARGVCFRYPGHVVLDSVNFPRMAANFWS